MPNTPNVNQISIIIHEIRKLNLDLNNLTLSSSFYYSSLPLAAIDAVFFTRAHYSAVEGVVERWCHYELSDDKQTPLKRQWTRYRHTLPGARAEQMGIGQDNGEYRISDFLAVVDHLREQRKAGTDKKTAEIIADEIFENHQRTSSRSGILKAQAVIMFCRSLQKAGIEDFPDLKNRANVVTAEADIRSIPGQRSGLTFEYFSMLAGDDDAISPSTKILRFVADALGRNPEIAAEEARELLIAATNRLREDSPNLRPRALSHAIWRHMKQQ